MHAFRLRMYVFYIHIPRSVTSLWIGHVRRRPLHNDVIKWKHFPRHWTFVRGMHRSPVNSPHKGQWRGALMFYLTCVWITGWENNLAGNLRRYRTHYDVIVMFVVVNFDALAQATDIQIERRQVVFLCWEQDSNPSGSQTPNRQQTECSMTNRLSYPGSSYKLELDSPSLWSASIQPTWPHSRLAFAPGSGDIHVCC